MSQENVETLRALTALWNAGERDVSAAAEYLDPAIELESPLSSVEGVPYRGSAGIEQWIRDVDEQFSEWRLTLEEVRDLDDRLIGFGDVEGRGRASGIAVEFPYACIARFAADRLTRLRIYLDVSEALADAGVVR